MFKPFNYNVQLCVRRQKQVWKRDGSRDITVKTATTDHKREPVGLQFGPGSHSCRLEFAQN